MWTTLASTSLVKKNDSKMFRIKEAPMLRIETRPWTAVQKKNRLALWISNLLNINLVNVGDAKMIRPIWLNLWKKLCFTLPQILNHTCHRDLLLRNEVKVM